MTFDSRAGVSPNSAIRALLFPRSIAVVGASNSLHKMGGRCVQYLKRHGFEGDILPINPSSDEIQGLQSFPSLEAVQRTIDAAIVLVPAGSVPEVIDGCSTAGVRAAVVCTSGFAELGDDGRALQEQIVERSRLGGLRIVGPNSNGLVSMYARLAATSNPALESPLKLGGVAIVSQSGGIGLGSIPYLGDRRGMGFSSIVSTGNEADLDTADFVEFLAEDDSTRVIGIILEGIKRPAAFLAAVRAARRAGKSIVALKLGRSELGSRLAASHTALLAGSDEVVRAVFEAEGIALASDVPDFLDLCNYLAAEGARRVRRIAVVSPSGGACVLAADLAAPRGFELVPLGEDTVARMQERLPGFGTVTNPLDLTAAGVSDALMFPRCVEILATDEHVDAVIPVLTVAVDYDPLLESLVDVHKRSDKVVAVVALGNGLTGRGLDILSDASVPYYTSITSALDAIGAVNAVGEAAHAHRTGMARDMGPDSGIEPLHGLLTEFESKRVLASYGVPTTREAIACASEEVLDAGDSVGFPVALKASARNLIHKTDVGGVRLGLRGREELAAAHQDMRRSLEAADLALSVDAFLVQEMVAPGVEVFVGVQSDPRFGPMLVLGLGGIFLEVLGDTVMRPAPVSADEARTMLSRLRGFRILEGARGVRYDIERLCTVVERISELAADWGPQLVDMDINPLMVFPEGQGVIVVDASIRFVDP